MSLSCHSVLLSSFVSDTEGIVRERDNGTELEDSGPVERGARVLPLKGNQS